MKRSAVGVAAVSCLVFIALLTVRAQTPQTDVPRLDVEKYTLANGLEVILSEDHRVPMVAVNLWYHVGPLNEAKGRTGFAHLFEHMMFQGSKHLPNDQHWKMLEGAGATAINGTTDFDRTNYFETVPSNQLEMVLWLEADRMGYLLDEIDQVQLSNQQDVVRNERRQSYENRPYGMADEAITHLLFQPGHPYYANVIGSHADIQAAKLEDVTQFYKLYYRPNNATLAIVGDIDKAATRRLVEKYFGPLKRGQDVPKVVVRTPLPTSERRAVVRDRVDLPRVYMTWLTPPFFSEGDAEADIAGTVLGGGTWSRLYRALVYEKQIAQAVSASQYSLQLASMFQIEATASPGHSAAEIEAAIDEVLDRFRREGPTAAELQRAVNIQETRTVRSLQRLGGFNGIADQLNLYNHYTGTPDYLRQDVARFRNATPDAVRRLAQEYLKKDARVVVHVEPGTPQLAPEVPASSAAPAASGDAAESVNEDAPWRAAVPGPSATGAPHFPVPQTFQLDNGLTVIVVEQPALPFVSASLVVKTGGGANPVDKPGLASFTASMLNQGTTTRSALRIAEDAAQIGAVINVASAMDASSVSTASLARNFLPALDLLADVALHPSFPPEEVERLRANRLAGLVQQRSNPASIAAATLAASLYGPKHPYGFADIGTEASNRAIARGDLEAFWQQHFVPGNAALVVAGAIAPAELRRAVESAFGAWPRGSSAPQTSGTLVSTAARLVIVDRPGSPQTMVRVASIGAARSSPDYVPLRVMNVILGGLFASRINLNLREEHGYTYGAGSQFSFRREAGPFAVSSGVRTDVTAPAIQEIFKEVRRIAESPVTDEELTLGRDAIARSLPGEFETFDGTVASLSSLFTYDLPLDYYSTLPDRILAVTADAVQTVAARYLVPEKMIVVAVGDRARIAPALESSLGPAELRGPEGVPVP